MNTQEITAGILKHDEAALARGITLTENRSKGYLELLACLYPASSPAWIIGITGPPGGGKSTLTGKLVASLRTDNKRVGVIAIDPTSPFSGGAILGDRIRMMDLAGRAGVFIRSMASRGLLGGLSPALIDTIALMEAFGCGVVIIETVGVGQSEVDIAGVADTTLVVLMPGIGDEMQVLKAGLMEIGDIFVVNKADREGADELESLLHAMLSHNEEEKWVPPVLKTSAHQGKGLDRLLKILLKHCRYLGETGVGREKTKKRAELALKAHLETILKGRFIAPLVGTPAWREGIQSIVERKTASVEVARNLLAGEFNGR